MQPFGMRSLHIAPSNDRSLQSVSKRSSQTQFKIVDDREARCKITIASYVDVDCSGHDNVKEASYCLLAYLKLLRNTETVDGVA